MQVERRPLNEFDREHNDLTKEIPDFLIQYEMPDGSALTMAPCFPPLGPMWLAEYVLVPDAGDGYADVPLVRMMADKGEV